MKWWLVKQEPNSYSFAQFQKDKITEWTGVRNFQARNNLKLMEKGDSVFYYHSGDEKQIVGLAEVAQSSYPEPTAEEGDWVSVKLKAKETLPQPVTLAEIKSEPKLSEMQLIKQSRLSVSPVTNHEKTTLLKMAGLK